MIPNDDDSSGYVDYDEKDDGDDSIDNHDRIIVIDNEEDDNEFVPPDYIFPSYFSFMLWGSFAEKEKQLPMFLLGKNFILYFSDLIFYYINNIFITSCNNKMMHLNKLVKLWHKKEKNDMKKEQLKELLTILPRGDF
jgi:hypothetical protein